MKSILSFLLCLPLLASAADENSWTVEGIDAWNAAIESSDGIAVDDAGLSPSSKSGTILTKLQKFDGKRSAKSLTIAQSSIWQNWNPIENLGPSNLADAPVLLTMGPDNYWMFGRYGGGQPRRKKGEKAKPLPKFEAEAALSKASTLPCKPPASPISSTPPAD